MKKDIIQLETLTCPSCIMKIEGALKANKGVNVEQTKIAFNASKVKVSYDEHLTSLDEIKASIQTLGFKIL